MRLPSNPQFQRKPNSLSINLTLPNGSFEDIFIKCTNFENESRMVEKLCRNFSSIANCTCDGLEGATLYKIQVITKKEGWNDSISTFSPNQYTRNEFDLI